MLLKCIQCKLQPSNGHAWEKYALYQKNKNIQITVKENLSETMKKSF